MLLLLPHRSFRPVENLTHFYLNVLHLLISCTIPHIPHVHGHLHAGFMFSTSMWWTNTRATSSPGISQAPVPHIWLVLPLLFPRADIRSLQSLLLGSGKGPFYPHGESESWGQSRVENQSMFLQEQRVRGGPSGGSMGGGRSSVGIACLPFLLLWMRSG